MITSSLVIMVITLNRRIPVVMARTWWAPGILWACGVKLKVTGADHLVPGTPYVFVSNHCSYLDIPVLFRAIPVNLYFVAKKEIRLVPFIGWYMMATGMIFVDRSNKQKAIESLKQAGALIRGGKNVLMFPEGTRSRDKSVSAFKKGSFMLASQAGVEVVPVAISGSDAVWQPGSFTIRPHQVFVNIGQPARHEKDQDIAEFIGQCREQVVAMKSGA